MSPQRLNGFEKDLTNQCGVRKTPKLHPRKLMWRSARLLLPPCLRWLRPQRTPAGVWRLWLLPLEKPGEMFSVGGGMNLSQKSAPGCTCPFSPLPRIQVPDLKEIRKNSNLSKTPASVPVKARGFQQLLMCGEWMFPEKNTFQEGFLCSLIAEQIFSRFGQKNLLISGENEM